MITVFLPKRALSPSLSLTPSFSSVTKHNVPFRVNASTAHYSDITFPDLHLAFKLPARQVFALTGVVEQAQSFKQAFDPSAKVLWGLRVKKSV